MGTFIDGESGSSVRTKINAAIEKTEGTSAISTIDVDGGAIDGVTIGTNSAVTDLRVDNLKVDGNTISSTDTNGDVNISPNGTGTVVINTDLDVDNININGNTISSTDTNGDVTIDPNGSGDVNIGNFKFDADQTVGAGQDNYVLTYDNAGGKISLEAAAGGAGGDPDLYRDNASSATTPSATGANAVAIGSEAEATGLGSISIGLDATGNQTNSLALGNYTDAIGNTGATAIGYSAQGNGNNAMALQRSYASGTDSLAAAIANNTSSYGAAGFSSIAIGYQAKAPSIYSVAIGAANDAGAGRALSIGGYGNVIGGTGSYSVICGGRENETAHSYSFASGAYAKADVEGKLARASGRFATTGDAQGGHFILRADTTDATATVLTTNNGTAGSINQIVAASDTCITFHGTVVAMQNGAQSYGGFKVEGLLVNDGGTTSLAASTVTAIQNTSGWTVALSADNTNNALAITVTGEAAHNIRWVANISTSEVTYA